MYNKLKQREEIFTRYIIKKHCFFADETPPVVEVMSRAFASLSDAYDVVEKECKKEVQNLQRGLPKGSFSYQQLGDDYDLAVLMWDKNDHDKELCDSDYRVVTGYKIDLLDDEVR